MEFTLFLDNKNVITYTQQPLCKNRSHSKRKNNKKGKRRAKKKKKKKE